MEFHPDSTEQVYVRPKKAYEPDGVRGFDFSATFVPAMTGLETDEPEYKPAKQNDLRGRNKPGDVLHRLCWSRRINRKWHGSSCSNRLTAFSQLRL